MGTSKHGYTPTIGEELAASKVFYELSQRPRRLTRSRFYTEVIHRHYLTIATDGSLPLVLPRDKRPSPHQVRHWWEKLRRLERPTTTSSRRSSRAASPEGKCQTARSYLAFPRESAAVYSIKPGAPTTPGSSRSRG